MPCDSQLSSKCWQTLLRCFAFCYYNVESHKWGKERESQAKRKQTNINPRNRSNLSGPGTCWPNSPLQGDWIACPASSELGRQVWRSHSHSCICSDKAYSWTTTEFLVIMTACYCVCFLLFLRVIYFIKYVYVSVCVWICACLLLATMSLNLKKNDLLSVYMCASLCVWLCVCVCVGICACKCRRPQRPEELYPPRAGVTVRCGCGPVDCGEDHT